MTVRAPARLALAALAATVSITLLTSGPGRRSPAPHRPLRVMAGDLPLRAVRAGRGPTIVLLHGYGESLLAWRGLFDRLTPHADVIALDLPGFGLSAKPASGYATQAMAEAVLDATRALDVRTMIMVGHSLGGAVAAAAALQDPERVSALVLVAPAGVDEPALLPDTSAGGAVVRAAIAEYEVQRTRFSTVHDPAWLAEDADALAYLPAADSSYRNALDAVLREFDFAYLSEARVARIRQPTLIIWGTLDAVLPSSQGRWLAEHLPDARLVLVERAWHRPHVERPAELADTMLAFVRTLQSGDSH